MQCWDFRPGSNAQIKISGRDCVNRDRRVHLLVSEVSTFGRRSNEVRKEYVHGLNECYGYVMLYNE